MHTFARSPCRPLATALLAVLAAASAGSPIAAEQQTPVEKVQVGLIRNEPGAAAGYTLFDSRTGPVFLIDNAGRMVHRWLLPKYIYHAVAELLPNGHLMVILEEAACGFGGDVAWLRPDGRVVWRYAPAGCAHHDHLLLPNGNVLLVISSLKTREEVLAAGANPAFVRHDGLLVDHLAEVRPTPPAGGEVVWRWSPWDHLVQDFDPDKPNYGVPADHPGRVDLNFLLERLSITDQVTKNDWLHVNAISYHAAADHVLLLPRHFSEVWVVDHSTTVQESAGRTGGRHGRGGDLLWRWGNPRAHGAGTIADQKLFWPHAAHWIPAELPGAGNILLFNNGDEFEGMRRRRSDVLELPYPLDDAKFGAWPAAEPHPPRAPAWRYAADPPSSFLSLRASNAHRLDNGNTLIVSGLQGVIFEVSPQGKEVWRYVSPVADGETLFQGDPVPYKFLENVEQMVPGNRLYRAFRYPPGHSGLKGLDLTPKGTVEHYR